MPNCKKCGNSFPNRIIIDGNEHSLSKRKYCLECSPFNHHNTKKLNGEKRKSSVLLDGDKRICTECKRELPLTDFYKVNGKLSSSECKICFSERVKERRRKHQDMAVELLGGKCMICGYDRNKAGLIFHHRESDKKELKMARAFMMSWEKIKVELEKCDLLCCRCHAELHNPRLNKY